MMCQHLLDGVMRQKPRHELSTMLHDAADPNNTFLSQSSSVIVGLRCSVFLSRKSFASSVDNPNQHLHGSNGSLVAMTCCGVTSLGFSR
jgi:hypothetical protein